MKKRCTNNKCREYFTIKTDTASCPYCGKKYPRLRNNLTINKEDGWKKNSVSSIRGNAETTSLKMFPTQRTLNKTPKGVYLIYFESFNKIGIIKTVKKWTGRGLKDSKKLVESAPVLIETRELAFTCLNSEIDELKGKIVIPKSFPLECFTKELDEIGCIYKIIY